MNEAMGGETEAEGPDPRLEIAVLGRDVERFIEEDPIGQYLVRQAQIDLEEAKSALLTVEATNADEIRRIQFKAHVAEAVRGYLGAAIQNGRDAQMLIQQERDNGD